MKTQISKVYYQIMPLIISFGCESTSTEISEFEKNNIIKEVRSVAEAGITAANNHDADAMMQVQWNSNDYLAEVNGTIVKGWSNY